ncbi:hypothetical protein K438DRAFT_1764648 [Mycena galopus ATCC 62051]|nr:hypothetical protein K438DRAFT_1764648 [Mycena galopus ATCC 62051]
MKLVFTSVFLTLIQLAAAQPDDYVWRLYNNGGCDHNSPASATSPPDPGPPAAGTFDLCLLAPQGISWNRLEVVVITTFCNDDCQGGSLTTFGSTCAGVLDGCVIGSFSV